jgi:histidinol-phosphatase
MSDYQELLLQATDIASRASKIALSYFRQAILIEMKENQTPVTIADKKTEEMIRAEISDAFPDHGILGEEFGHESKQSDFLWTIDPIDGTRSFIRGIPLFGTLLGLLKKGKPVLGVMILPALEETYSAAEGLGSYCNGVQCRVSSVTALENALVSCGDLPCFESAGKKKYVQSLMAKAELTRGYTDCFGHALVIRGSVDAMVDPIVSPWDIAPIACLVKEAGGGFCNMDGEETVQGPGFLSFARPLKDQLLKI